LSPVLWASVAGMTAFALSSEFSSFSFRSAQNGVVFFMVLAVAVNEIAKSRKNKSDETNTHRLSGPIYLPGFLCTLLLAGFCAGKAFAEYQVYRAERSAAFDDAQAHFRAAVTADPEYAGAYLSNAARTFAEGDAAGAAILTRKAIDNGIGLSLTYSQLAKYQIAAHDPTGADKTFREALSIYPRSIFIRTEYVVFLENQGKLDEAAKHAAVARAVDIRQANGWYAIITKGSVAAFYDSQAHNDVTPPAELVPYDAVRQYVDKIPGMVPAKRKESDDH
jgi:tetratricopeptide (TPR) repeat protein